MKYKILQLDANGRISFTKEELEKLLDEVYEDGRRDASYYWYRPYLTWTTSQNTITTNPDTNVDKWKITIGDIPGHGYTYSSSTAVKE